MPLADWFAVIEVEHPGPAQQAFLDELATMLDDYQPAELDCEASRIQADVRGPRCDRGTTVWLVHARDAQATVEVALDERQATIEWLSAHEHVDVGDDSSERSWTAQVVDAIAALLRGDYEVQDTYLGRLLVKTRVVDVAEPSAPRILSTTVTPLSPLALLKSSRERPRRVSFGVQRLGHGNDRRAPG
jgi:hypothetical protein